MGIIERSTRLPVMYGIVVCTVTIGTLFVSSSIDQNTRNSKQYESYNSAAQRAARKLMGKHNLSDKAIHVLEKFPLHKEYFYDDSYSSLQYDLNRMENFIPFFASSQSYDYSDVASESNKNPVDNTKPHVDSTDKQLANQLPQKQSTKLQLEKPFVGNQPIAVQPQKPNQDPEMAPKQLANKLEPPSKQQYQSSTKQQLAGDEPNGKLQVSMDQQVSGKQDIHAEQQQPANQQKTVNNEPAATQQKQFQNQSPLSNETPSKEQKTFPNEQQQPSNIQLVVSQPLNENKMSASGQQSPAKQQPSNQQSPVKQQLLDNQKPLTDQHQAPTAKQQPSANQQPPPNQGQAAQQQPPANKQPFSNQAPAAQQQPPANKQPSPNQVQDVQQQPPANQQPSLNQAPAAQLQPPVNQQRSPNQVQPAQQQPPVNQQPSPNQVQAAQQQPPANQQPSLNQAPVAQQQPPVNQQPSPNQVQAVQQQPPVNQQPSLNQVQAAQQQPDANQQPFPKQAPAAQQQPPVNQQPSPKQAPAAQQQPPVNQQPSPKQAPAAQQQPPVNQQPSLNQAPPANLQPPSNQQPTLNKKPVANQENPALNQKSPSIKQPPTNQQQPSANQQQPPNQPPPSGEHLPDTALAANPQPQTNKQVKMADVQNVPKASSNISGYQNESCKSIKLMTKGSMPLVALLSSPGSGNTWTRFLIEHATGIYTGSVYDDVILYKGGFLGELEDVNGGTTVVTKTHFFPKAQEYKYSKVILLVRNPYNCILSEFNRQKGQKGFNKSHVSYADPSLFQTSNWTQYAKGAAERWFQIMQSALKAVKPSEALFVYYESLLVDVAGPLEKMVRFLGLPVEKSRLECTKRISDKSGFHRPHKSLGFDPYSEELTNRIQNNIEKARQLILKNYNTTFPKYEKETFK